MSSHNILRGGRQTSILTLSFWLQKMLKRAWESTAWVLSFNFLPVCIVSHWHAKDNESKKLKDLGVEWWARVWGEIMFCVLLSQISPSSGYPRHLYFINGQPESKYKKCTLWKVFNFLYGQRYVRLASELWTFKIHSIYHYEMDEGWLVLVESVSKADFPAQVWRCRICLPSFWSPQKSMPLENLVWRSGPQKSRDFTHLCCLTGRGPALRVVWKWPRGWSHGRTESLPGSFGDEKGYRLKERTGKCFPGAMNSGGRFAWRLDKYKTIGRSSAGGGQELGCIGKDIIG